MPSRPVFNAVNTFTTALQFHAATRYLMNRRGNVTPKTKFMRPGERTLLKTFPNVQAAEVALGRLQANGIHGSIESNDAGGMLPFLQVPEGVKLFVPSSQFDDARELLESSPPER